MFRTFLLEIRRIGAKINDKQRIALTIILFILWVTGIILDLLLPYNLLINSIRAIVCLFAGLLAFSLAYLLSINIGSRNHAKNENYVSIRQRFTYRGRLNMSIVFWAALIVIVLMSSHPSVLYTFINSWLIVAALSILTFVRASRNEYLQLKYGVPDKRDLDMDDRVNEAINKRRQKAEEKRAIKERKKEERWTPERKLKEKDNQ